MACLNPIAGLSGFAILCTIDFLWDRRVTQVSIEQQRQHLEEAVAVALEEAGKLGVTAAEVAISKQQGLSISTRQGEVETVEFNKDGALGISLYRDGSKGNASTSDLSPQAIVDAVRAADGIARYTTADEHNGLADASLMPTELPDLDLYHPHPITPEQGIELASRCEQAALAEGGRIEQSDGASCNSHEGIKVYGNSHGFIGSYASSRHSLSCVLIGKDEHGMERDYDYTVSRRFDALDGPEALGKRAAAKVEARLGAHKIDTCEVPVLFSAETATGLIGHLVGAISGASLYRESSFLLNSLGTQILPDWFSIHENPHLLRGLSSAAFDGEGVATQARDIVIDGVLQSYLLTAYSGRRLKMATTGHAGGIYNWDISSNGGDLAAMLKQMGTGLYVTELMGHGVNSVTGDYSRGAAGFWVENGIIQYPVHEITIAGNLKQMYREMVAVGSDRDPRSSIGTGSILLSRMKVAGN
ncbi:microcin-processing peptidase 1. Unknown type peptidase. MEROPS family U62 [Ferrimonas sediminum]|uniref:PmbA protein n=1 Tax=Ferrimonas sediminum TaxID=718193 RepID=A0A1G8KB58_9GAMM|nr:microcin-processing peptidase 1. Unknown type peptidase. MEROPS family U62 [Ferrimonas sediminum]